jgi:hypothetical protein
VELLLGVGSGIAGTLLLSLSVYPDFWHHSKHTRLSLFLRCVCCLLGMALLAVLVVPLLTL